MTDQPNPFFSDLEVQAREIMAKVDRSSASTSTMMVLSVFRAMWSSALTADRVERIACAIHGFDSYPLNDALTNLCRAKVLRSRMVGKHRLYEINFTTDGQ